MNIRVGQILLFKNLDLEFTDVIIPFNDVLLKKIGRGAGPWEEWRMGHEDELFRYKIKIWIFFVITNFALSFIYFAVEENNLILDISASRFLKFGPQELLQLQMEFL